MAIIMLMQLNDAAPELGSILRSDLYASGTGSHTMTPVCKPKSRWAKVYIPTVLPQAVPSTLLSINRVSSLERHPGDDHAGGVPALKM